MGKSHLAIALGVKAVEHGFSVAFFRLARISLTNLSRISLRDNTADAGLHGFAFRPQPTSNEEARPLKADSSCA